jgi:hypothetical protein
MEDLFKDTFQNSPTKENNSGVGWGSWLIKKLGINIQVTTSTNIGGKKTSRQSSYSSGGGSYTSRSTRTEIENGQRIMIQSYEKDGNKIEEKYAGEKLIERRINGVIKKQIGAGQEF